MNVPAGYMLQERRLDETAVGVGTTVTLIDGKQPAEWAGRLPRSR
jgi:hypothetical protein